MKKTNHKQQSQSNLEFVKNRPGDAAVLNHLLIPTSILLAGVLIMVSVLISAISIKNEFKDLKTEVAKIQVSNGAAAAPTPQPTITQDQLASLYKGDYIKFGDEKRKVTFVEFSDPSCPYCHVAAGKNPTLNKEMGTQFIMKADGGSYIAPVEEMKKLVDEGKASFIWIYTNGHGNGILGTQALYCAYEKGKFWEVHDQLMSSAGYSVLNDQVKNDVAKSGDLAEFLKTSMNKEDMKSCLESGKYSGKIASDQSLGSTFGVSGTPGFFVNTTAFAGAYSYTDMEATVKSALD